MHLKTNMMLTIVAVALILGSVGDFLFSPEGPWNVSGSIWVALLSLFALFINRHGGRVWLRKLLTWSGIAFAVSLLLTIRDAEALIPLVLLVQVACASAVLMQANKKTLIAARVEEFLIALFALPVQMVTRFFRLIGDLPFFEMVHSPRLKGVLRGLLIVAPLLVVFTLLFSSADANFERYTLALGNLISVELPQHVLSIALMSAFSAGLLLCTMPELSNQSGLQSRPLKNRMNFLRSLGDEEIAVIMGSLVILFLVFVLLQFGYLFGGRETIEQVDGLTLATYARRGFFELIAVSLLTLVVLLWMSSTQCNQRIFRPMAVVLVVCVLFIMASAAQRLYLYSETFGLTLSRVLAAAIMLWLAGNLVSFIATLLRSGGIGFAFGMFASGIATVILLGLANPAAIVTRVNLSKAITSSQEQSIDIRYLTRLGADAVPPLLERIHHLPSYQQCIVAYELITRYGGERIEDEKNDWRTWNASRSKAKALVAEHYNELVRLAEQIRFVPK
ncbi:MAG: DUF4173 domain-containing protein [Pseudohongiella nitratireducens]|nr:DUF4173 domain-containing protein [Pseudohongiella nitratireducens]MDF1622044.1 DUF4173 domain-containing protein [Pseudohongiella nitratireducens]